MFTFHLRKDTFVSELSTETHPGKLEAFSLTMHQPSEINQASNAIVPIGPMTTRREATVSLPPPQQMALHRQVRREDLPPPPQPPPWNPIDRLHDFCFHRRIAQPKYKEINLRGTPHAPIIGVIVTVDKEEARASSSSKNLAKVAAAEMVINRLRAKYHDCPTTQEIFTNTGTHTYENIRHGLESPPPNIQLNAPQPTTGNEHDPCWTLEIICNRFRLKPPHFYDHGTIQYPRCVKYVVSICVAGLSFTASGVTENEAKRTVTKSALDAVTQLTIKQLMAGHPLLETQNE